MSKKETILITGTTSGIGYELMKQLYQEGHKIIAVARNKEKLSQISNDFDGVITLECDLSLRIQVECLASELSSSFPEITILINNAGVQYLPGLLDESFSFDSIEKETRVNFLSPVWLTTLLIPQLLNNERCCKIINISSSLVYAPKSNATIYCASKSAIHNFTRSLRMQLEKTNIRVQEVFLPLVDTKMTKGRGKKKVSAQMAAKKIISGIWKNKQEIHIGVAKILPILTRISPKLVQAVMRRA